MSEANEGPEAHALPVFQRGPPVIYGDGQQTRDFTYVDDVVDANRTLLTDGSADGDVVNIESSDNISI